MKKILFFAVALVAMFVLESCGGGNSPSAVAEKSMECLKNKDYDGYANLLYFDAETMKNPEKLAEKKSSFSSLLKKTYEQKIADKGDIKDYKIISEDTKDSVSVVRVAMVSTKDEKDTIDVKLLKDPDGEWKLDSGK